MQLFLNATSPYARVARIAALEKGFGDTLALTWVDPWADDPALLAVNPIGRVPVLVTEAGTPLTESLLIARHLDTLGAGPTLFPTAGSAAVLSLAGVGYGLMEAAFHTVIARKQGGPEADGTTLGRRRARAIDRSLHALDLDRLAPTPSQGGGGTLTIGLLVTAVALDYVAFRLPEIAWPATHPALAAWHESVIGRDSFRRTRFA
ncbi:glutathione S-transferase [Roseospira marina]|uniref:Glutathione S-transferase n=2 Tax=Roseospira marina TaxID=140057 RepID=A0A5M6I7A4_9PROT|nr:glutathione S-transferase [Roseospira marina]